MDRFPSLVPLQRRSSSRIALLLGIALSLLCFGIGCGDFCLFCDDEDDSQDPCSPDPCEDIADATADTCKADGTSDFTCSCSAGFWDEDNNLCKDPCDSDPCDTIDNATAGSCTGVSANDYTCTCDDGFIWDGDSEGCEEDPCDPDPCGDIDNAVAETCTGVDADEFTCECESAFVWDGDSCETSPCDPDPCASKENATAGTCTAQGADDYTCDCDDGYIWNAESNVCEEVSGDVCEDLKACLKDCSRISDAVCLSTCYAAWSDCDCVLDWEALVLACGPSCSDECENITSEDCWDCVLDCGFDDQCS